jgi:hypothetical protein
MFFRASRKMSNTDMHCQSMEELGSSPAYSVFGRSGFSPTRHRSKHHMPRDLGQVEVSSHAPLSCLLPLRNNVRLFHRLQRRH